ncbi:DUF5691 domain-containing protein [Deinococcus sp.]|uniref:DUF5691 domain-containing protein n=1 Tax=Deinococcus sp. TaxID=47478 RepID=UPI003CC62E54
MSAPDLELLALAARRGTARQAVPEPSASPLGAALSQIERDTPEATLLARAALAGLHAQAGRAPARASTPAPIFQSQEAPAQAAPAEVVALLPHLQPHSLALLEALRRLHAHGLTLNAADALPLLEVHDTTILNSGALWPVLDEVGRWLARLNPVWKKHDPAQPSEAVALERLKRELVEAHASDPEATTQDLLARWPTLKADERPIVMKSVAGSLHPADLPLLQLAQRDRLENVRRLAHLLPAHLPGELAERTRAALQALVKVDRKGKLKVGVGEIPSELRDPLLKKGETEDEAALLLGAIPLETTLTLLSLDGPRALIDFSREYARYHNVRRSTLAGISLKTLSEFLDLAEWALDVWPQARIRERLWEAVELLLSAPSLDSSAVAVTNALFQKLNGPLELPGESGSTPQNPAPAGLLQRLRRLVSPTTSPSSAGKLHRLAERLLHEVAVDLPSQPIEYLSLLRSLVYQLDAAQPLPALPPAPPAAPLPAQPTPEALKAAERRGRDRAYLEAQYAALTRILELRRQLHALLPEPG